MIKEIVGGDLFYQKLKTNKKSNHNKSIDKEGGGKSNESHIKGKVNDKLKAGRKLPQI